MQTGAAFQWLGNFLKFIASDPACLPKVHAQEGCLVYISVLVYDIVAIFRLEYFPAFFLPQVRAR
jgi:hypothetical protein